MIDPFDHPPEAARNTPAEKLADPDDAHVEARAWDFLMAPAAGPLKDSGSRETFATGSRRDTREGKGRFDLLFRGMPEALRRMAVLLERGAKKYGERNWEKGQPISRFLDSAIRHLQRAAQGHTDEDHLIQAAWNCMAAVETLRRVLQAELPAELNDVYPSADVEPR